MSLGDQHEVVNQQDDHLASIRRESNIRSYSVIRGIMGSGVIDSLPLRVRCECGVLICEEIIEVSLDKRRELRRSYPRGFIVVNSHANSPIDPTVYQSDSLSVIEKLKYSDKVTDL